MIVWLFVTQFLIISRNVVNMVYLGEAVPGDAGKGKATKKSRLYHLHHHH